MNWKMCWKSAQKSSLLQFYEATHKKKIVFRNLKFLNIKLLQRFPVKYLQPTGFLLSALVTMSSGTWCFFHPFPPLHFQIEIAACPEMDFQTQSIMPMLLRRRSYDSRLAAWWKWRISYRLTIWRQTFGEGVAVNFERSLLVSKSTYFQSGSEKLLTLYGRLNVSWFLDLDRKTNDNKEVQGSNSVFENEGFIKERIK